MFTGSFLRLLNILACGATPSVAAQSTSVVDRPQVDGQDVIDLDEWIESLEIPQPCERHE